jgi:hypothetical protein
MYVCVHSCNTRSTSTLGINEYSTHYNVCMWCMCVVHTCISWQLDSYYAITTVVLYGLYLRVCVCAHPKYCIHECVSTNYTPIHLFLSVKISFATRFRHQFGFTDHNVVRQCFQHVIHR